MSTYRELLAEKVALARPGAPDLEALVILEAAKSAFAAAVTYVDEHPEDDWQDLCKGIERDLMPPAAPLPAGTAAEVIAALARGATRGTLAAVLVYIGNHPEAEDLCADLERDMEPHTVEDLRYGLE